MSPPRELPACGDGAVNSTRTPPELDNTTNPDAFQQQLAAAHSGSSAALGEVLESCRNYLLLVADMALKQGLQAKLGASDIVQETFLEAQRIFDRFEGRSEEELLRWLSQILQYKTGNVFKRYFGAASRNVGREIHWEQIIDSADASQLVHARDLSPSAVCRAHEEHEHYHQALLALAPEQQQVIRLRVNDELTFDEIGRRMNRTADASRMLFARAVFRLNALLKPLHDQRA